MADQVSVAQLRDAVKAFLEGADLSSASTKKVRLHLNEKFHCDFTGRKKEIDKIVMDVLTSQQDGGDESDVEKEVKSKKRSSTSTNDGQSSKKKKKVDSEDENKSDDDDFRAPRKAAARKSAARRASNGKVSSKKTGDGSAKRAGGGGGRTTGYLKKLQLSPELAEVMGEGQMARNEVVKKMYEIVKQRELLDPKNRQFAILDPQLQKIFRQKRIRMFGMMKLIGKHFTNPVD